MKSYPTISTKIRSDRPYWCFDKRDGSNIRAEWSKKRKEFYKFGSRKRLIDGSDIIGESIELIKNKYEKQLSDRFIKSGYESVVCFFEFFGPSSFAGQHVVEDHDVILFDIAPYKKGILKPAEFIALSNDLDTPGLVYHGILTNDVIASIKDESIGGITFEGVVCKNDQEMSKIKTTRWLEALKEKCGDNKKLYELLV